MGIRSGHHDRRNFAAEKFMINKPVSAALQAITLQRMFPNSIVKLHENTLEWIGTLQPSPYSAVYTIKIEYNYPSSPKVSVISPALVRRSEDSDTLIPHMYDQKFLCLYYPKADEWRRIDWLHKSIIPWASNWLYYYEIWQVTGQWLGGGIEHGLLSTEDMKDEWKVAKNNRWR